MIARSRGANGPRWHAAVAVVVAASAATIPAAAAAAAAPANVAVTPAQPRSYQEPTLAVDPRSASHLAVSYQDGLQKPLCGLATSNDAGATWTNRTLAGPGGLLTLPAGYDTCRDTAIAFGPDGTLFYVVQASDSNRFNVSTVTIAASRDGGATFSPLVPVRPATTDTTDIGFYQPSVAVDATSGRVHVAWLHYRQFSQNTVVETASSTDHGRTFSAPVQVSADGQTQTGSVTVVAGQGGRVTVAWLDATAWIHAKGPSGSAPCPAGGCPPFAVEVRTSTDQGRSFGSMVTVDNHVASGSNDPWRFSRLLTMAGGTAAGPLALAWWEPSGGFNRVVVAASSDRGAHWSAPSPVAPPAGHEGDEQDRAMLAVAPSGRVDLAYADLTPADASGARAQSVFEAFSTDGGRAFSAARQVTDVASNTSVGPARPPGGSQPPSDPSRGAWFGRHFGLVALDAATLVAWADSRRGTPPDGRQDVYFARVVAATPASTTTSAPAGDSARVILIVAVAVVVALAIAVALFIVVRRRRAVT